jgi:hypothetical protein
MFVTADQTLPCHFIVVCLYNSIELFNLQPLFTNNLFMPISNQQLNILFDCP